jgi:lysylphosphatidylglycerol synthetase-like protein (DUF2156 family)
MDGNGLRPACQKYGHSPLSYMTLNSSLCHFTDDGAEGYIAWKRAGGTAVALTDPITCPEDASRLMDAFREQRRAEGDRVAVFGATGRFDKQMVSMGFRKNVLGYDSVLDVPSFSLGGNKMENVRRGVNHARRSGLEASELSDGGGNATRPFSELHRICGEWLRIKRTPELENVVWKLGHSPNPDIRYFVARSAGRIEAFATFNPIFPTGDWYLDLTRRRADSPNGVLDFLLVEAIGVLRAGGARRLYLGMVPEPDIHRQMAAGPASGLVGFATRFSDMFYPVEGARFFKSKYGPRWTDTFIFSDGELTMSMLHDLFLFVQPGGLAGILGHKVAGAIF